MGTEIEDMRIIKRLALVAVAALAVGSLADENSAGDVDVLRVNGVDVLTEKAGDGWEYTKPVLTLYGQGPFVLSGVSVPLPLHGQVHVRQVSSSTVVFSNLVLIAYDRTGAMPTYRIGASEEQKDHVNARILLAGANEIRCRSTFLSSDSYNAGIFVSKGSSVTFDAAEGFPDEESSLEVVGGCGAAGIGGSSGHPTGSITIDGGTIKAASIIRGAGIGGGEYQGAEAECAGSILIRGGIVKATGSGWAMGIGYGSTYAQGDGYHVEITGGNVEARGGESLHPQDPDIASSTNGTVCITGGNVKGIVRNPRNGNGDRLWRVTVPGVAEGPVEVAGLPLEYGTNDIVSVDGSLHFWLPDGDYLFRANDRLFTVKVEGADAMAALWQPGVSVNGTDITEGSGEGWTFADKALTLSGPGPYVLSGLDLDGAVHVRQEASATVVLSNLLLRTSLQGCPAYSVGCAETGETSSTAVHAEIRLYGANLLANAVQSAGSLVRQSGISVWRGSSVRIDKAEGLTNAEAYLWAEGGAGSAGIGGCRDGSAGRIVISGGTVYAKGGVGAAGIGGGDYAGTDGEVAGWVKIEGGMVEAVGGAEARAIGAGREVKSGEGYDIRIEGGTVNATQGEIASSSTDDGHPVRIIGGNVTGPVVNSQDEVGNRLWRVTVPDLGEDPGVIAGLPNGYGTKDVVPIDGNVYLWLPNGTYDFTVNGASYMARVAGGNSVARRAVGVSVNGTDLSFSSGAGWDYVGYILTLSGPGPFVLSGTNLVGEVQVRQDASSTVVLSNLVLETWRPTYPTYSVGVGETTQDAPDAVRAEIRLFGTNRLESTSSSSRVQVQHGGISVWRGSTVRIDKAEGLSNAEACLKVVGGCRSAGIGGCMECSTGRIIISGGTIFAQGGYGAAGIGGGDYTGTDGEVAGSVLIEGGVVEAVGGSYARGIGAGREIMYGDGYDIRIQGGTVRATEGGIASSSTDVGQPARVTGGNVTGLLVNPRDEGGRELWQVTVPELGEGPVVIAGLPNGYGTKDIVPIDGNVYLWLPNGEYVFKVNGVSYCASVNGGETSAVVCTGFTVNGVDLAVGKGRGWTFDGTRLTIDGSAVPSVAFAGEVPRTLAVTVDRLAAEAVLAVSVTGSVLGVSAEATFTLSPKAGVRTFDESAFAVRSDGTLRLGNGVYYFNPAGRFDAERQVAVIVGDEVWIVIDRPQETGITVNALDIGGVEWTSEDSVCHFDTNAWTLAFNDGLHFSLAGTNLTDRAVRMGLAPAGLSVSFTNLVIEAGTGNDFVIAPGGDDRCWGSFTNAADEVRLGEGFYAFDPSGRILDGLFSLPYGNGRWRVVPEGTFKAKATVDGLDYGCCSLAEALALAGCGGRIELLADIVDEPLAVGDGASFLLVGNGHVVAPILGAEPLFTVSSNAAIRIRDVTFDGRGGSAAGFAAVEPSGSLVLNDVTVRNMKFERGAPLIRDDEGALTVSGLTASGLSVTNFSGSASLIAVANRSGSAERVRLLSATLTDVDYENLLSVEAGGVAVSGDFPKGTIVLRAGELTWIEAVSPVAGYVLSIVAPDRRVGSAIVKGGGVSAADVRVCQAGYAAFASGVDVVLDTVWSQPFAVMTVDGAVTNFAAYASFEAARTAAGENAEIRLVDYVNDAIGLATNVVVGSATVPAGSAVTLGTVLRHSTDGTNTIWSARSEIPATLAGDLTVAGTLRLADIVPGGAVTVTGEGVIGIAESFCLTNTMLYVTVADPVARAGSVVITSDFWTPAQLKAHCRVTNAGWTLAPSEIEGLSLVTVGYDVARVGEVDFPSVEAAATAVAAGGTVGLVSYTNVTTGLSFDEVTTTGRVLAVDRSFTLASCLKISDGLNYEWDFAPAVPTVFNLDGVTLKLGSQTVLTLGNVRIAGTLTLAGEGLLDVTEYAGMAPIAIRLAPGAQGVSGRRIAKGEARQFVLAGGEGRLVTVDGYVCWESDTITCTYEQVANGVVSVKIFKGPTCVKTDPSVEVHRGRATYRYQDPETHRDCEFTLKAVFVDWQDVRRLYAPNGSEYMTTRGVYKAFEGAPEDGIAMPNDIHLQRNGGLHVRCRFLRDASAEPELSRVSNDEFEYVAPEVVSEEDLEAYLNRNPEAADDLNNPDPESHGSDIVSAHIALEGSLLAMSGGQLAKGALSYRLFKQAFTVFGAFLTVEDLLRSLINMTKKAIDFHDNPLVYGDSYGRGRFKELCERCAKDNGAGDAGKAVYLRHAIDLDALMLATAGSGFVRFDGEFTTPGREVAQAFVDYSSKIDCALDVVGIVSIILDAMISFAEKSVEKLSLFGWILAAAEKAGALIENCLLLIYRYEFFNPPIDKSISIGAGVKYDIQNVKFDANRNTRYTRKLDPSVKSVRTAPLLVAREGSTLEFSSAELKNYGYSSPSGLVYVCSGATLVLKDFSVSGNAYSGTGATVPPIVAAPGANIWVCGGTSVQGIASAGADLRVGYGPHGTDDPKSAGLSGQVVIAGETPYGARIGGVSFPDVTTSATGRIVSGKYGAWLMPTVDGDLVWTVRKEKVSELTPIAFDPVGPFAIGVLDVQTNRTAVLFGKLVCPTAAARAALPLEFRILQTDSLTQPFGAAEVISVDADGRFLKEVDGLKSSPSRFFRLDYEWKDASRP